MEDAVEMDGATEEQPEETDLPSEQEPGLGTVIDPETGTEYEILSSVEDILPEEFTDEEIAEAVLEEMSELVDDVLSEMEGAPEEADAEAEPVPEIVAGVQALFDDLPSPDDFLNAVDENEIYVLNYRYWLARQSYDVLTEDEQGMIDTSRLDAILTALVDPMPQLNSPQKFTLKAASTTYRQEVWAAPQLTAVVKKEWTDAKGNYHYCLLRPINCHWIYDTSDGHACYCIRPDMGAADSYYYNVNTDAWEDELTQAQRDLIRRILLYGYPNCRNTAGHSAYHNSTYCQASTQMLIWEVITKCLSTSAPYKHTDNIWSDKLPASSDRNSWYFIYWNMLSRIQNDGWIPSWLRSTQAAADAVPIELELNASTGLYEATIINTTEKVSNADYYSHMLDDFEYSLPSGVTITRDTSVSDTSKSQTIKITATAAAIADGEIQISVKTPYMVKSSSQSSYPATVYLYGRNYSGNVWYQPMIQVETVQTDPIMAYMTLKAETGGGLKIVKTSDDGKVSGITFTVKNNDTGDIQTVKTGDDGTFLMEKLIPGSYTVTETVGAAYVADPVSQTVTVEAGETTIVSFSNTLKKFRVKFTKVDAATGTPQGDASLAGAVYGLYQNNKEVARYTTDTNGQFTTAYFTCGSGWTLKEITPPPGYTLDTTVHSIGAAPGTFTKSRNTVETEVKETVVMGQISVTKKATNSVAGTTQNESSATFEVYLKSAGSYANANDSERDILTTDESGRATSKKLPYGTYILHQTFGWEGHILDDTEYELPITTDGKTVPIELENEIFKGTLQIVKQDKYTATPLDGATFQIMDSTGVIVYEGTTGDDGVITADNLVYGKYIYVESDAPEGYQRDETVYDFSIEEDGQTVRHTRENIRIPGSIAVFKTDASGNPLSGVTYELDYSTDGGRTWKPVYGRSGDNVTEGGCTSSGLNNGQLITCQDGVAKFEGLRADGRIQYKLTETATRSGYSLLKDPVYKGTLPVDGDSDPIYEITFTVRESVITGLPMAGSRSFALLPLAVCLAAASAGLVLTALRRRRPGRHNAN